MKAPAALTGRVLLSAAALAAAVGLAPRLPFGSVSGGAEAEETAGRRVPDPGRARSGTLEPGGARPPCGPAAGPCSGDRDELLARAGLAGLALTPAAVAPRTEPVPLAAGAREIARYRVPGLTLFLDRPAEADLALELAALAFHEAGWRPAGGPGPESPGVPGPAGEVFVRGGEVAVVTLDLTDSDEPILLLAYQGSAGPREDAR